MASPPSSCAASAVNRGGGRNALDPVASPEVHRPDGHRHGATGDSEDLPRADADHRPAPARWRPDAGWPLPPPSLAAGGILSLESQYRPAVCLACRRSRNYVIADNPRAHPTGKNPQQLALLGQARVREPGPTGRGDRRSHQRRHPGVPLVRPRSRTGHQPIIPPIRTAATTARTRPD